MMLSALYSDVIYKWCRKENKELRSSEEVEEQSIINKTDLVSCWFFSNLHSFIFFFIFEKHKVFKN